ncbi:hypothetical protein KX729_09600 [Rhizobium sp. XQZ8]|uniref:hypothetical protein n=1 Tax=Rhizobium populisoli TaxID=2859785 RepID=UPI001CA5AFFE|nr:hypothetical protein [Rhizobium populisoli]MBW6421694.1 hypothetical protein [Rhizobium populisoli]
MDDVNEVLRRLKKAKAPHRTLDIMIGLLAGYSRTFEQLLPGETEKVSPVFIDKSGQRTKMPDYTRNLDEAVALAETLMPGTPVAFTWEGEVYRAQVWDAPPAEAPDLSLAICTAIFEAYAMQSP